MAHHNKLPAAGVNPALMPTAAEKAALDASLGADGANPFVTHGPAGDLTNAQLTALAGATVTNIPTNSQKEALDASVSPALGSSNPVAGRNDLVVVGRGTGLTGNVTWTTGRTWLNGTQYKAIGLFFPSTGPNQSVVGAWTGSNVTFNSLIGTGELTAIIFRQDTLDVLT